MCKRSQLAKPAEYTFGYFYTRSWLGALHVPLIALSGFIETHDTDLSIGVQLLSEETLLQAKNSTGQGGIRTHVLTDSTVILNPT